MVPQPSRAITEHTSHHVYRPHPFPPGSFANDLYLGEVCILSALLSPLMTTPNVGTNLLSTSEYSYMADWLESCDHSHVEFGYCKIVTEIALTGLIAVNIVSCCCLTRHLTVHSVMSVSRPQRGLPLPPPTGCRSWAFRNVMLLE